MQYLLRVLSNTKGNAFKIASIENVLKRPFSGYRTRPERSNLIKVAVVGSGSLGEPSSLIVKTCDNFVYVSSK